MPSLSLNITQNSELHKRIVTGIMERIQASKRVFDGKYNQWKKNEDDAQAFMPEKEVDAIRRGKREGGTPQYTTIFVPYSYGMLMTSHTYWTTVFLSRSPVIQFAGRHGETEQQVQALEALISYNVDVGQMVIPWYVWLYDVGKYGVGVLGTYWAEEFSLISSIEEVETKYMGIIPGPKKRVKVNRRVKGYEGNKNYNIRPYDFFPDPRVTIANFQKGEFFLLKPLITTLESKVLVKLSAPAKIWLMGRSFLILRTLRVVKKSKETPQSALMSSTST